jgi:AraC-like DNA-binding protein
MDLAGISIRPGWISDVNERGQEFLFRCGTGDRVEFESALRRLSSDVPNYTSIVEREWLRERLAHSVVGQAATFHIRYHDVDSRAHCGWSPVERLIGVWERQDQDPRDILRQWIDTFVTEFDAHHPMPVGRRTAAIVRESFNAPPDLSQLAKLVGASRAALTRAFRAEYGMSIGQYITRVRLRWVSAQLRTPGSNVKVIAAQAGYASRKSLYGALNQVTGLGPREIRTLSESELEAIAETKLSLRSPRA